MITFILLTVLAMIAVGALVLYKASSKNDRQMKRASEASNSGASMGRASGGGDN